MKRLAGWFGIVVGLGMVGMWVMFFLTDKVPEVSTAPIALGFHLTAEGVTAFLLITSGIGLLLDAQVAPQSYRVGIGMLLYTVIVSAGYFAQLRQWPFVAMFAAIGVLALFALRGARLRS
jgi:hypothetical protein